MLSDERLRDAEAFVRKALATLGQEADEATIQRAAKKCARSLAFLDKKPGDAAP